MKSLIDSMRKYNSWVLHCSLKHKFTEEVWWPLAMEVKTQMITVCKYEVDTDGIKNPHKILGSSRLTIEELYEEFEIF